MSKAQNAAIAVANIKVERVNQFYLYHKEIIDEWIRLKEDAQEATAIVNEIKIKRCLLMTPK